MKIVEFEDERKGAMMTVQTVKLGRERFVLLREKDYRELKAKAEAKTQRAARKRQRLTAQDRADVAEAARRRNEPVRPYAELRKDLRLA